MESFIKQVRVQGWLDRDWMLGRINVIRIRFQVKLETRQSENDFRRMIVIGSLDSSVGVALRTSSRTCFFLFPL